MDINFKKSKYKIILGSGSPRRKMYFDLLKIPYKVMISNIDEIYPTELKESEISDYLAKLKSKNLKSKLEAIIRKMNKLKIRLLKNYYQNKFKYIKEKIKIMFTSLNKYGLLFPFELSGHLLISEIIFSKPKKLSAKYQDINFSKNMITDTKTPNYYKKNYQFDAKF